MLFSRTDQQRSFEMKMRFLLFASWCINLFRPTYIANVCGHKTKESGCVRGKRDTHWVWIPLSNNNNPDYCLQCTADATILCVRCKQPIHIGDAVTLYEYSGISTPPRHARRHKLGNKYTYVGCTRDACASRRAGLAGFWMQPGKVVQAPSVARAYVQTQPHAVAIVGGNFPPMEELSR